MSWTDNYKTYDTSKGFGNKKEWKRSFWQRLEPDEAKLILQEDDPWAILGIPQYSTKEVIKKAYKLLMIKWHPDKNPNDIERSTKMSQKINAAYSLLI